MATIVIASGVDTYVDIAAPTVNFAGAAFPVANQHLTDKKTLVHLPGIPQGNVVLSATLACPVRGPVVAFSGDGISVKAIGESWSVSKVTYDTLPTTVGSAVATPFPSSLNDGDTFDMDVTAIVQAIAAGQANYGFQLVASGSTISHTRFYGFDSGHESWTLTIETSDQPIAPTQMTPQGVISLAAWQCQVDDQDDIAQMRVLVDPAANPGTAFDTGWVSVTSPVIDLATTTYPGLADAASTSWCAAVKTTTGAESDFGDWVQVTRRAKPTLVMDSPPAGLVYDSTPTIEAHLEKPAGTDVGDATTRWQVRLLAANDPTKVLYNSGSDINGAVLSHTIPHRWRNKVVVGADGPYRLQVKCWDRSDRVGSYGDPPYLLVDETMTVDVDGTIDVPSGLVASQPATGVPDVLLHWTADADPEYFTAHRDGVKLAFQIDPDTARIAPGVYEWVDASAAPNIQHSWRIRAHVGGKHSDVSVQAQLTPDVVGFWIRSNYGTVLLFGNDVDSIKQTDKRTTFPLPYAFEDVDVVGAVAGYSADSITLAVDARSHPHLNWTQSVDAACAILEEIRQHPAQPVQLTWGTVSIPAYLRGLSIAPHSKMRASKDRTHTVTFGLFQTDDVEQAGFGVGYYGAGTYF